MILESVCVGESPVTGVTLISLALAGHGQQPVVLLLADHSHDLAVRGGERNGLSLHHLLHLFHVLLITRSLSNKHLPLMNLPY